MAIDSVLDFAHTLARRTTKEGDVAVDATVGNGHDTVALAACVGPTGRVFGFDVQEEALDSARARLTSAEVDGRVELIQAGHEEMVQYLPIDVRGDVSAVTFNLGYLPGSGSDLTTRPDTTLAALRAAVRVVRVGGVVTVVAYTGHEGGQEETEAVEAWMSELSQSRFRALSYTFVNQVNDPPRLYAIEKTSAGSPSADGAEDGGP